jgi:hypothetical protein
MRVGSRQISVLRMMVKPLAVEDAVHRLAADRGVVTEIFRKLTVLRYAAPHGEPLKGNRTQPHKITKLGREYLAKIDAGKPPKKDSLSDPRNVMTLPNYDPKRDGNGGWYRSY